MGQQDNLLGTENKLVDAQEQISELNRYVRCAPPIYENKSGLKSIIKILHST